MNKSVLLTSTLCGVAATTLLASPAEAQVEITDSVAQQQPIPINIVPGKASAIHFPNSRSISYIILSDRSRIVYSLNAPPNSGEARSIFLRQIEPLSFPGQTTHTQPNLHVVAIDNEGRQSSYEFIISNSSQNDTKIKIVPDEVNVETRPVNAINTELGLANPYDVLAGLKYKLKKGELSPDSQLVLYTSEAISTTLNSSKTLLEVAGEFQVPLSVLAEFGRVGLMEKAKARRLQARAHPTAIETKPLNNPTLKVARRPQIEANVNQFIIDTDLGAATLDDVKFGLSVLRQRNQISEAKAQSLEKAIQGNLDEHNTAIMRQFKKIARIGLAFETRLRLRGTIN